MAENEKILRNYFSPAVHKGPQIVFFKERVNYLAWHRLFKRFNQLSEEKKQRNNSEFLINACTNTVLLIGEHDLNN